MNTANKILVFSLILCLAVSPAFAAKKKKKAVQTNGSIAKEIKFRDVPLSHWASKAVYKLVSLGVTAGFPDDTFRGKKYITRFETASFLANLADSLGSAGIEKLGAELKSELKTMRNEIDEISDKSALSISGKLETNYYVGNIFTRTSASSASRAPQGPVLNYRLAAELSASFENDSGGIKATFDTMDGGFYGGSESLLTKLLDIETVLKPNAGSPLTIIAALGPGPQQHPFGGTIMPSEYGRTYMRPYSGIKLLSSMASADISMAYLVHNIKTQDPLTPGEVGVNQVRGRVSWPYDMIPVLNKGSLAVTADHFSQNINTSEAGATNGKLGFCLVLEPVKNIRCSGELRIGSIRNISTHTLAVIADVKFDKYFNDRSDIRLKMTVAGNSYLVEPTLLDQWSLLGFDPFDRPIVNSAKAIQAEFSQGIGNSLTFVGRGTLNLSPEYKFGYGYTNSRLTVEGGFNIVISQQSKLNMAYRLDNDPNAGDSTTDLFIFGLASTF